MTNLLRKVFILSLLFLIVISVYLIKNESARTDVFARLGLASSKDFQIPDNIKIGLDDIYMERITIEEEEEEEESSYAEVIEREEEEPASAEASAGEVGSTSIEAWEEKPTDNMIVIAPHEISLEEVEEQIVQITQEIEKLQKQMKILIAMNEIEQEINNLAEEAEGVDIECSDCNILSSI